MNTAPAIAITIDPLFTDERLIQIQQLRYKIYAEEMHIHLRSMDHQHKLMPEAMDSPAIHICALSSGQLSGAVRLNHSSVPPGLEEMLQISSLPQPFVYCARLFVCKEHRGSSVVRTLVRASFQRFAQDGAAVAVCHCYGHLLEFYKRLGFRPYGTPFAIPGLEALGLQTPMYCDVNRQSVALAA